MFSVAVFMVIKIYLAATILCLIYATVITYCNVKYLRSDFERDTRGRVLARYLACFIPIMNFAAIIVYTLVIMEITGVNEWLDKDFWKEN